MIITVIAVRMVKMAIDQIIDVVAMGNGFMPAAFSVDVSFFVT